MILGRERLAQQRGPHDVRPTLGVDRLGAVRLGDGAEAALARASLHAPEERGVLLERAEPPPTMAASCRILVAGPVVGNRSHRETLVTGTTISRAVACIRPSRAVILSAMQAPGGSSTASSDDGPVAHFVTTRASKIVSADDATATLMRRSVRSLVGRPLAALVDLDDRSEFRSRLAFLPDDGVIRDWRVRLQLPDGGSITAIATVETVPHPWIDGTERNLHWSMAADGEPETSASDPPSDAMGQLTDELVHEINQPLAAIVSYARGCVLRANSNTLSAEVLETAMERIVTEAMRASALLRAAAERWR